MTVLALHLFANDARVTHEPEQKNRLKRSPACKLFVGEARSRTSVGNVDDFEILPQPAF